MKRYQSNLLIIDIEGGEEGLLPIINYDKVNKILIEFHPDIIGDNKVSNLIKFLIEKSFTLNLHISEKEVCYFYKK